MKTAPLIVTVIVALLATLVGCGGGEKATPTPAAPSTPIPLPKTASPTPSTPPAPPAVDIPLSLKGAKNLGSLQIEVVYNPAALEATEVKAGDLAKNAMMESNLKTPGRVKLGVIDASGINGDGALAILSFKIINRTIDTPITVEKLEAYTTALVDMRTTFSSGSFLAKDSSFKAPVISLAP